MMKNVTLTSDRLPTSQPAEQTLDPTSLRRSTPVSVGEYHSSPFAVGGLDVNSSIFSTEDPHFGSLLGSNSEPFSQQYSENSKWQLENSENSFDQQSQQPFGKASLSTDKTHFLAFYKNDLERIFEDYLNSYNISLVESDLKDSKVFKVLEEEGCPICLSGSHQSSETDPCAIFSCKMTNCFHVFHLSCIYQNSGLLFSADKQDRIELKNYHSLSFLVVQPFYLPEILDETTPQNSNKYQISLTVSHIISNVISMKIDWPEPINSMVDLVSQKEFIFLSLEKFSDGDAEKGEQPENLPMFSTKRGKIFFSCTDAVTQRSWSHESNYDIYLEKETFLFVFLDKDSKNILTLGLRCEQVSDSLTAYSLLFVRYEFAEELQTPIIALSSANSTVFAHPSVDLPNPSPLYNDVSPYFVQNEAASFIIPITNNSVLYKIAPNSPIIDYLENNRDIAFNSKIGTNGQLVDFISITSPVSTFVLPSSHSPSVMAKVSPEISEKDSLYLNQVNNLDNFSKLPNYNFETVDKTNQKKEEKMSSEAGIVENSDKLNKESSDESDYKEFNDDKKLAKGERDRDISETKREYISVDKTGEKNLVDKRQTGFEIKEKYYEENALKNKNNEEVKKKEKNPMISALLYNISIGVPINKPVSYVIKVLSKQIFLLSKSQYGSRFIQDNLSDMQHFLVFYEQLRPHVADLMIDNFGHYAFEAMFALANEEQKLVLLRELASNIHFVACHKQGSFSLQSIMDNVDSEKLVVELGEALRNKVHFMSVSCSGHYVILRYLVKYEFRYCKFISEAVSKDIIKYASDHYGLRVVKSLMDVVKDDEIKEVYVAIVRHANRLIEDQFGNYIVQHVLDMGSESIKETIKQRMLGKFVGYSKQKFSSNVVEKCLRASSKEWQYKIVREIISVPSDLINDKYGNYCLQTALTICDKELTAEFSNAIVPYLIRLRENVRNKWIKLIENANTRHNSNF